LSERSKRTAEVTLPWTAGPSYTPPDRWTDRPTDGRITLGTADRTVVVPPIPWTAGGRPSFQQTPQDVATTVFQRRQQTT